VGQLLVAVPGMYDPNFNSTVVYVFDRKDGAAGVILNRPSDLPVPGVLPDAADLAAEPPVVFFGGPVRSEEALVLTVENDEPRLLEPSEAPTGPVRVFAGHAGWGPGQLEGELDAGGWYVFEARSEDILTPEPHDLWRRVFARQSGPLRRYRLFPDDPRLN